MSQHPKPVFKFFLILSFKNMNELFHYDFIYFLGLYIITANFLIYHLIVENVVILIYYFWNVFVSSRKSFSPDIL